MAAIDVAAEEAIAPYGDPGNGSGPLWCYGSSTIARDGDRVFVSLPEVGEGVPPLCNTRWQLFARDGGDWPRVAVNELFDEREPCPLLRLPGRLLLSVNPSTGPRGGSSGVRENHWSRPQLLEFDAARPGDPPRSLQPVWDRDYAFTEHSYRGAAACSRSGEVLLLNVSGRGQAWSLLDAGGDWSRRGLLEFPLRGCYPNVALRQRAAWVVAVSDIVEPNAAWRELKRRHTGRDWDYDFRQLFYSHTPALGEVPFSPILTFASRDETAGMVRDELFPEVPMTVALKYARIHDGAVAERRVLRESVEDRGPRVGWARFHDAGDGRLFVLGHVVDDGGPANFAQQLLPSQEEPVRLDLRHPLGSFLTASGRLGSEPSTTVDLCGPGPEAGVMRYVQLRIPS
ncbi:MAG: hypothetical protein OXG13_00855 [Gemmatimonadaceae bacterium]|nr:hypothetical protein [Gemmatimonadaceae bacterium]